MFSEEDQSKFAKQPLTVNAPPTKSQEKDPWMMADFKVTLSYLSKHNPEMPMEAVI
jgi:hypothetical protein